jgi:DMSO/TMAO reductase YedYZ molybdopterin-dependent catalytic subunit
VRRRRVGRLALAGVLTLLVAASLAGGFAWVASGRIWSIGPWTILTLHVWAGLAIVPILVAHLVPRRWRVIGRPLARGRGVTRRSFLGLAAVATLGAIVWGAANVADAVRGGSRRFTGSRWLPDGGVPPPTTFYGEPPPELDAASWALNVTGRVERDVKFDAAALGRIGSVERDAVLDCTSGWAMRTRWRGTPLSSVLAAAGADPDASQVRVRSATGWMVALDRSEAADVLLATHVAGQPLPAANGAPLRLVAPSRRGLDWIKWVVEVEVA